MAALSAAVERTVEETRAARLESAEVRARARHMRDASRWQRARARHEVKAAHERLDRLRVLVPERIVWTPLTNELDDVLVPVD